jgi:hypothetical protein
MFPLPGRNTTASGDRRMRARAKDGAVSKALIDAAIGLLQEAERLCPRTGRGAEPKVPDWMIGRQAEAGQRRMSVAGPER